LLEIIDCLIRILADHENCVFILRLLSIFAAIFWHSLPSLIALPHPMTRFLLLISLLLGSIGIASAHHFKGLPHYNYFENYPQIPEEEFIGEAGDYEVSLVLYDFQGINRDKVDDPEMVRMFMMIFNLRDNRVYGGALTLEILDRGKVAHTLHLESAELENLYSWHRDLPNTGKYSMRMTLHDEGDLQCTIPFRLSSQKVNWGWGVAGGLALLVAVSAVGARKARVRQDRIDARKGR
jgi:hypothetical protein